MNLIDTHCHLTFEPLHEQIGEVLERSIAAGVSQWITVGTDIEHSRAAVQVASGHAGIWATAGIHPHEAKHWHDSTESELAELCNEVPVVAVGEIGLDFHYSFSSPSQQEIVFETQLHLAAQKKLPVVVHTREAFDRTLDILEKHLSRVPRVVLHCFSGNAKQAERALGLGLYLSFTGVVTFKNAQGIRQAAQAVPLDRLMIETDCPYMSPEPVRKQRINEPAFLVHTARFLAQLKDISWDTFVHEVGATSTKFFALDTAE